jgi:hypothetical protein
VIPAGPLDVPSEAGPGRGPGGPRGAEPRPYVLEVLGTDHNVRECIIYGYTAEDAWFQANRELDKCLPRSSLYSIRPIGAPRWPIS